MIALSFIHKINFANCDFFFISFQHFWQLWIIWVQFLSKENLIVFVEAVVMCMTTEIFSYSFLLWKAWSKPSCPTWWLSTISHTTQDACLVRSPGWARFSVMIDLGTLCLLAIPLTPLILHRPCGLSSQSCAEKLVIYTG